MSQWSSEHLFAFTQSTTNSIGAQFYLPTIFLKSFFSLFLLRQMAWNGHHWSNALPLPEKKSSGIKERTKRILTTPLLKIVIFCGCRRIINESNIHDVLGWVPRAEFVSSAHVTDTRLHQPSIVPLNRERMNFTFSLWKLCCGKGKFFESMKNENVMVAHCRGNLSSHSFSYVALALVVVLVHPKGAILKEQPDN